jgi:hypothetical protein
MLAMGANEPKLLEYLVVAGGGGADTGGGGAGGFRTAIDLGFDLATNYTVTVGAGGAGGNGPNTAASGSSSVF